MGEVEVPADALWRAQTQRAVDNFPISGPAAGRPGPRAGPDQGRGRPGQRRTRGDHPRAARRDRGAVAEIVDGEHDEQFPIDVFQTGSGTSTNMNVNEVISSLTARAGVECHPNDVVNASQSSNDTFPSAIHVAAVSALRGPRDAQAVLHDALDQQAERVPRRGEVGPHPSDGRHPGDVRAGARRLRPDRRARPERVDATLPRVRELALGGTAVGTGINTPPGFAAAGDRATSTPTPRAGSPRPRTTSRPRAPRTPWSSSAARSRPTPWAWSRSATTCAGWARARPPGWPRSTCQDLQPGSSIMPGKVNPVIPEATLQVCAQVIGNDTAITFAGASGSFELNVMLPVLARNLLESIACSPARPGCWPRASTA